MARKQRKERYTGPREMVGSIARGIQYRVEIEIVPLTQDRLRDNPTGLADPDATFVTGLLKRGEHVRGGEDETGFAAHPQVSPGVSVAAENLEVAARRADTLRIGCIIFIGHVIDTDIDTQPAQHARSPCRIEIE